MLMMVVTHTTIVTYPRSRVQSVGPFHYVPSCRSKYNFATKPPPLLPRHAAKILPQWSAGHRGYTGGSRAHDTPLWHPSSRRVHSQHPMHTHSGLPPRGEKQRWL